jgi:hypothetical protein
LVAGIRVSDLLNGGVDANDDELEGIDGSLEEEAELLTGGEGRGFSPNHFVEGGHDAQHALLLFLLELTIGLRAALFGGLRLSVRRRLRSGRDLLRLLLQV